MSTPKTRIQKGKELEDEISKKIRERGLDSRAERSKGSGSGNREKADISTSLQILNRNIGLEVKNHETLKLPEWWKQVEKLETLGREPVLVFKIPRRNPRVILATVYLDTLLDLIVATQNKDDINSNLTENYHYDKVNILNSIKFIKQSISRLESDYNKKVLKEE